MPRGSPVIKELNMIYHLLLLTGILLTMIGQLFLKKGMRRYEHFSVKELPQLIKNKAIIIGLASYGTSMILWLIVLSKLDLSYAYPLVSLDYFFIALASKWVFHERITKRRWLSISIIVAGVILVSLS